MSLLVNSKSFGLAIVFLLFSSSLLFSQENLVEKPGESVIDVKKEVVDVQDNNSKNEITAPVENANDKKEIDNDALNQKDLKPKVNRFQTVEKKAIDKLIVKEKKVDKKEKVEVNNGYKGDGLLYIVDGEFRYNRIPGNEKPKIVEDKVNNLVETNVESFSEVNDDKDKNTKGLFGLSKSLSDKLAYGFLFFLVLMIFFMYRVRSKSNRR